MLYIIKESIAVKDIKPIKKNAVYIFKVS